MQRLTRQDTDRYDEWLDTFTMEEIDIGGVMSAVYRAPRRADNRPVCVFVHGINGDHHGLVPVAYLLKDTCRVVFADLPGHGKTDIPRTRDPVGMLRTWAHDLLPALKSRDLDVAIVVGHSFGAYVAQESGASICVLLNPPFETTLLSRGSTVVLRNLLPLVGRAYHSRLAMLARGHWLMHARSAEADAIVEWSSKHTHITSRQMRFQTRLADKASERVFIRPEKLQLIPRLLIVLGEYDRIIDNSSAPLQDLPSATVVALPTDHVSVFEAPVRVAEEIRKLIGEDRLVP